jgi:hypothetical protein
MGLLDHFEKLINEHGSAAILREHLALVKAEQSALERKNSDIEAKCKTLQSENAELQKELGVLKSQVSALQSGNTSRYVCDHCGSPQLKRTGSIIAIVSAVLAVFFARIRSRALAWFAALLAPFLLSYALYWAPVWLGAGADEYDAWAIIFLVPWYFAGAIASCLALVIARRQRLRPHG